MKCHEDNKEKQGTHKHSPMRHLLHMAICCGLPIVIVGLLPLIARFSPSGGELLAKIAPFICPVMMIAMLPMMFGKSKQSCCDNKENNGGNKQPELNGTAE